MNQPLCSGILSLALFASAAFVILTAAPGNAKLTPAQKCGAAKLKATSKKADSKDKCYVQSKLAAADPACLQKAEQNFVKAFAKAESAGGCSTTGDAAMIESSVDTFVAALVQALQPQARTATTPAEKCAIAKLLAASKETTAKLKCHQGNLSAGSASKLSSCLSTAEAKFAKAFAKAEAGPCAPSSDAAARTTGDAATIGSLVDAFVTGVDEALVPQFVDNGDGTITDNQTGLMWEKKDQAGGLHDVDTYYLWAGLCGCTTRTDGSRGQCTGLEPFCQPDADAANACSSQTGGALGCAQCSTGSCNVDPLGKNAPTTIWGWLAQLNASNFAGHSDWRLPTTAGYVYSYCLTLYDHYEATGQRAELESILAAQYPNCTSNPCVPQAFNTNCTPGCSVAGCSCTASRLPNDYWSASTIALPEGPWGAWIVFFGNDEANVFWSYPGNYGYVRAVR